MKLRVLIVLIIFSYSILNATNEKTKFVQAKRLENPIKIDGILNEGEWTSGTVIDKFTQFRPNPGQNELAGHKTIAYILYDDTGIYFGGKCYEQSKDSISTELIGRDGFGNNDFIGIIFDTYKDNINGFEYFVTPLNEQMDAKQAPNNNGNSEDFSWNSVWKSATSVSDDGWSFEIFIPFASIRFPKKEIQDWGLMSQGEEISPGSNFFGTIWIRM
ncbi:MAG: carbohydrate binding family 9 domain-containing protein [Saprospiraceae bacterium]|nr:carbohydrate binding family 9 domain-containing protein [Saprospiraceae bacterium]